MENCLFGCLAESVSIKNCLQRSSENDGRREGFFCRKSLTLPQKFLEIERSWSSVSQEVIVDVF